MALFQRKPIVTSGAPLYTLGLQKTIVFIGLGNPGKQYEGTRHNIGFNALDHLANKLDFPDWIEKKDLKAITTSQVIADTRVILIKPTTFMNLSGDAVQAVSHFYKISSDKFIVVYDELDIPFGQIRVRVGGSAAGHNGVQSIINTLGDGFGRIRIGIRNEIAEKADSANFVLGKFSSEEKDQLPNLLLETNAVLSEIIHGQPLNPETRNFLV
ncbi:MAG: aminoacyl-tRNA hydrolase [Candidatus Saccharibacteria bacterium]